MDIFREIRKIIALNIIFQRMKLFMASIPIIKEAMQIGKLIQIPTLDFLIFRFLSNAVILIVFYVLVSYYVFGLCF